MLGKMYLQNSSTHLKYCHLSEILPGVIFVLIEYTTCMNTWQEGKKKREPDFSQWCLLTVGTNWNTWNAIWTQEITLVLWGWSNKLPREALVSPSVETIKTQPDMLLGNLL